MRVGKTSLSPVSRLTTLTPAGISGKYHLPKIGTLAAFSLAVSILFRAAHVSALASRTMLEGSSYEMTRSTAIAVNKANRYSIEYRYRRRAAWGVARRHSRTA